MFKSYEIKLKANLFKQVLQVIILWGLVNKLDFGVPIQLIALLPIFYHIYKYKQMKGAYQNE